MAKTPLFTLPMPSTTLVSGPIMSFDVADMLLSMNFDDIEQQCVAVIRFRKVRAFCKRAELHCSLWHSQGTYDQLCEILPSAWVDDLRASTVEDRRELWTMRHFMIFVDSYGCLEVVGESVAIETTFDRNSGGT